jgi:hypothetical protein
MKSALNPPHVHHHPHASCGKAISTARQKKIKSFERQTGSIALHALIIIIIPKKPEIDSAFQLRRIDGNRVRQGDCERWSDICSLTALFLLFLLASCVCVCFHKNGNHQSTSATNDT